MIIVIVIAGIVMKSIIGHNYICKSTSKFAKCVTLPMKLIFKYSSLMLCLRLISITSCKLIASGLTSIALLK